MTGWSAFAGFGAGATATPSSSAYGLYTPQAGATYGVSSSQIISASQDAGNTFLGALTQGILNGINQNSVVPIH